MDATQKLLDRLSELDTKASPAPWFVRRLDDEASMGAIAVASTPPSRETPSMRRGDWPSNEVIACCLLQSPPYALLDDDREEENAALIAELRNALPELLRLAALGFNSSSNT